MTKKTLLLQLSIHFLLLFAASTVFGETLKEIVVVFVFSTIGQIP